MKWHTVTRLFTEMYNFLPFVFLVVKWFLHRKLRLLLIKITGQSKVIWSSRSKSRLAFIFYLILYHLTISLVKNKMANRMVVHCCSIKTIYLCLSLRNHYSEEKNPRIYWPSFVQQHKSYPRGLISARFSNEHSLGNGD